MNNFSNNKLDDLITRLSIVRRHQQVISIDEFISIEQKISVKIPKDYQHFCQTLGSGRLDDFLDIYCMVDSLIAGSNSISKYMIDRIHAGIRNIESGKTLHPEDYEYYKSQDVNSLIELLYSALIFGIYNGECVVLWDLRTYDDNDDSYDIYWCIMNTSFDETPLKVGRNFTDFICDFCYGQLPCQLIPEIFPESPREIDYTFDGHEFIGI